MYFILAGHKMLAVSTWNFGSATAKAWETLKSGGTAVDAVEKGQNISYFYIEGLDKDRSSDLRPRQELR
jgi:hypothetical protein